MIDFRQEIKHCIQKYSDLADGSYMYTRAIKLLMKLVSSWRYFKLKHLHLVM